MHQIYHNLNTHKLSLLSNVYWSWGAWLPDLVIFKDDKVVCRTKFRWIHLCRNEKSRPCSFGIQGLCLLNHWQEWRQTHLFDKKMNKEKVNEFHWCQIRKKTDLYLEELHNGVDQIKQRNYKYAICPIA